MVRAADNCLKNPTLSFPLHVKYFPNFGMMVLSVYHDLHEHVNRWKEMDVLSEFLSMRLWISGSKQGAAHVPVRDSAASLPQRYSFIQLRVNDKMRIWKRKNKGRLEEALGKANALIPRCQKYVHVCESCTSIGNCCSGRTCCLPIESVFFGIEEQEGRVRGPMDLTLRDRSTFLFEQSIILLVLLHLHHCGS